jgi:hypothetical protein
VSGGVKMKISAGNMIELASTISVLEREDVDGAV